MVGFPASHVSFSRGVTNKNQVEEFLKEVGPGSLFLRIPLLTWQSVCWECQHCSLATERERERETEGEML